MSLNWYGRPPAIAEADWDPYTNAEQKTFIYATQIVRWNEITQENHVKWFMRLRAYESALGPLLIVDHVPTLISLETVQKYIGLRTNADCYPDFRYAELLYLLQTDEIIRQLRHDGVDTAGLRLPDVDRITVTIEEREEELDTSDEFVEKGDEGETVYDITVYKNDKKYDTVYSARASNEEYDWEEPASVILDKVTSFIHKRFS